MINLSFSLFELEYFLLILVRITCFIFTAPFFSMANTPKRVRIAFGVFVSYLVYQSNLQHDAIVYNDVLSYAAIVVKEAAVGLLIGMAVNVCNSIIVFAGRLIDMEIGLAMASTYDPTTKENASVSGLFYQYFVMLILLISNMHLYLIGALVDTFKLIPVNQMVFHMDSLLAAVIKFASEFIVIGFRIALPVFCVMLISNCILGIMAKLAPQMNMFSVGIQIKLLMGLAIMFLTVGMLPYIAEFIFDEMKTMMVTCVEALMP